MARSKAALRHEIALPAILKVQISLHSIRFAFIPNVRVMEPGAGFPSRFKLARSPGHFYEPDDARTFYTY